MKIDSISVIFIIEFVIKWSIQMAIPLSYENGKISHRVPIFHDDASMRDKRALGIFLQGLIQALGYNTTPIQLASLPNPGISKNIVLSPINKIDVRAAGPELSLAQTTNATRQQPRQQETLRFTGVVNFGNNSDLLGHLRQYETIFHGSGNSTIASPEPSARPSVAGTPPPLLQPLFVPIPIPLADNLQYPKPLLSLVKTLPVNDDSNKTIQQTRHSYEENGESYEDLNDEKTSNRPPLINNNREKNREHRPSMNQSSDEKNSEDFSSEGVSDEQIYYENGDKENKSDYNQNFEVNKQTVDNDKLSLHDQHYQDRNNFESQKIANYGSSEQPYDGDSFKNPESYVSNKYSSAERFRISLPIDIKPFKGQLMNSYGHSLKHNGKIDDTVVDYFAKYKNPRSGIFEQRQQADQSDYSRDQRFLPKGEYLRAASKSQDSVTQPRFKFEEYKLNNAHQHATEVPTEEDKDTALNDEYVEKQYDLVSEKRSQNSNQETQSKQIKTDVMTEKPLSRTIVLEPFEFIKFTPYYRPIQYIYSPTTKTYPPVVIYKNAAGHKPA